MNSKWKPISTAPMNGDVVLTELGTYCYVHQSGWGSPVVNGWYLCQIGCQPWLSGDEEVQPQSPQWWMDLPEMP